VEFIVRILLACFSGLLLAVSFPPFGWWFLAPVAVATFTLTVLGLKARSGFGYGFVLGLVFFLVLLRWVSVIGGDAWLALGTYSALWLGFVGWGTALLARLPGWPASIAILWVAVEAIRDRIPLGGWPWGRLGFSQADGALLEYAWLGGTPALTAVVALIGTSLAGLWVAGRNREWGHTALSVGVLVAVFVVAPLISLASQGEGGQETASDQNLPSRITISIVQGDVPQSGLDFNDQRRAVLDNHVSETVRLADRVAAGLEPQPEAVIWPENSSDIDPFLNSDAAAQIDIAARAIGVPILVGAVLVNPANPNTVLNVGIVWDPETGPGQQYVKQHPVPFGEYIPFRSQLAGGIGRFDRIPRDFVAGDSTGVLDVGPVRMGDVICFEVAYDDLVRDTVLDGARMLAVQTNNATYTGFGQTEQQLAMARIRAIEHGRTVAVAATNGISALFSPDGTVVSQIRERTAGTITAEVPLRDTLTPSDRIGWWPELLAGLVSAVALGFALKCAPGVWPRRRQSGHARPADLGADG
jgi:apolipoprotein N-acyltransferase